MPRLIDHGLRDGKKAKKAKSKQQPPKLKGKRKGSAPYTEALGKEICERLAAQESLRSICKDNHIPSKTTVLRWAYEPGHPLADQYARAREIGYHAMADEILEIADDSRNDFIERLKQDGEQILVDHDHISRSRLRIESRKWILSKRLPKIYGDQFTLKGDKENPLNVALTMENLIAEVSSIGGRIPSHQGASERLAMED